MKNNYSGAIAALVIADVLLVVFGATGYLFYYSQPLFAIAVLVYLAITLPYVYNEIKKVL